MWKAAFTVESNFEALDSAKSDGSSWSMLSFSALKSSSCSWTPAFRCCFCVRNKSFAVCEMGEDTADAAGCWLNNVMADVAAVGVSWVAATLAREGKQLISEEYLGVNLVSNKSNDVAEISSRD